MSALPTLALLRKGADAAPSTYQSLEKGTLPWLCTPNNLLTEVKDPGPARKSVTVHQSKGEHNYWHLSAAQWQAITANTYLPIKW